MPPPGDLGRSRARFRASSATRTPSPTPRMSASPTAWASVLGDAERRLLRLAGGARHRAHPVEPRLAIAARPAPSRRRRAGQAAAPDAEPGAGDQGPRPIPAVRHAGRRRADPGDAAGAAEPLRPRPGRAVGDRSTAFCDLQLSVVLRALRLLPRSARCRGPHSRSRSPPSSRGAGIRSNAGPTGSGPPAPSARSSPTAAAASWKPAPTLAVPPTLSAGDRPFADLFGLGLE